VPDRQGIPDAEAQPFQLEIFARRVGQGGRPKSAAIACRPFKSKGRQETVAFRQRGFQGANPAAVIRRLSPRDPVSA